MNTSQKADKSPLMQTENMSWEELKDAAIAYCRRAFPDVPLVMPRCRNPHDGIADSLCILQYGLRSFGGNQI
jgi:hypothetical protein